MLLAEQAVGGPGDGQPFTDHRLGAAIGFGHLGLVRLPVEHERPRLVHRSRERVALVGELEGERQLRLEIVRRITSPPGEI